MVSVEEIERNDFNLNIPRYIDSQQAEDRQDIEGHLKGGIPAADIDALSDYWSVCPKLRHDLFHEARPGYLSLTVEKSAIKLTIYGHPEFAAFIAGMNAHFAAWRNRTAGHLRELDAGCHPREVIAALSEDLLAHYAGQPLIDPYDVYQHLLDYWEQTMQDDLYQIAADGWKAETYRIIEKDKKGKEKDRGWACDLVPRPLIVARYFAKEQAAIDQIEAEWEAVVARIAELEEEHGGDDGAFSELDRVNRASVAARLKELDGLYAAEQDSGAEAAILKEWLKLNDQEASLRKKFRTAEADLDAKAYAKYPTLTEAEVQTLAVDDKWLAALDAMIHGEMDRISRSLTRRVKELVERYETSLPEMTRRVFDLEAKVNCHLERICLSWK